jgi:hypothetical protein
LKTDLMAGEVGRGENKHTPNKSMDVSRASDVHKI